ncbi:hypothetical protein SmJEL517_g00221 [Synchytrium microbalum]|uniref:Glycosyltransferase 2-like domain-containing protein n=1 Tax=Synchytrium microbalum TaxID=1806994 RepID=A0A507CJZ4_9FUNG|nr:uncharacterized protein SmJEL517_g00221 [Synchytrium microbalum]TPX38195.1 hypothetical protein SmJEL517_g00221 [Synchytrium microbalum]
MADVTVFIKRNSNESINTLNDNPPPLPTTKGLLSNIYSLLGGNAPQNGKLSDVDKLKLATKRNSFFDKTSKSSDNLLELEASFEDPDALKMKAMGRPKSVKRSKTSKSTRSKRRQSSVKPQIPSSLIISTQPLSPVYDLASAKGLPSAGVSPTRLDIRIPSTNVPPVPKLPSPVVSTSDALTEPVLEEEEDLWEDDLLDELKERSKVFNRRAFLERLAASSETLNTDNVMDILNTSGANITADDFKGVLTKLAPDEFDSLKKLAQAIAKTGVESYMDDEDEADEKAETMTLMEEIEAEARLEEQGIYVGQIETILANVKAQLNIDNDDPKLILPSAPTAMEKHCFLDSKKVPLLFVISCSSLSIMTGMWLFATSTPLFLLYSPFILLVAFYYCFSVVPMIFSKKFDYPAHRKLVEDFSKRQDFELPSVDVLLPCCGESLAVLNNTYMNIKRLKWGGKLKVWVLDDGWKDEVKQLAYLYGFEYIRRADRPHLKKAGNMRNAFKYLKGDFMAIFDADFCPRPEFLYETVPYMYKDPSIAILQTPQYFRCKPEQTWIERGAGLVQEQFYRVIQVGRDTYKGAICVGTSALYRHAALEPFGGTAAVEHSEDVRTGFMCMTAGYNVRYIPVVLSMGICPYDLKSFFNQQYRWCSGSADLLSSKIFWETKLTLLQRACFLSGIFYYFCTAAETIMNPLPAMLLIFLRPEMIKWFNICFAAPSMISAMICVYWWSVYRASALSFRVRTIQFYAHLFAIKDRTFGTQMGWVPSGQGKSAAKTRYLTAVRLCTVWCTTQLLVILGGAAWRIWGGYEWYNFVPMILLALYNFYFNFDLMRGYEGA